MKLIDAEKLIKDIRAYADLKCVNGEIEIANGILKSLSIIENEPTAYDVDKVVEELNKSSDHYECDNSPNGTDSEMLFLTDAIEIVRRGGKNG